MADDLAPDVVENARERLRARTREIDRQITTAAENSATAAPAVRPADADSAAFPGQDTGRRIAKGAARTVADVPKAGALAGRAISRNAAEGSRETATEFDRLLAETEAQLADPNTPESDRAGLERLRVSLEQRRALALRAAGVAEERLNTPLKETRLYEAGAWIDKAVEDLFGAPDASRNDAFTAKLAEGGGSLVGFLVSSAATRAVGPLVQGVAMGAVGQYEAAIAKGADEATALQAAGLGGLVGTTEVIPFMRALAPLDRAVRGKVIAAIAYRIGRSASEEAAQEAVQGLLDNLIAQNLYDPEKGLTDGVGEQALIGAILGGGAGAVGVGRSALRGDLAGSPAAPGRLAEPGATDAPLPEGATAPGDAVTAMRDAEALDERPAAAVADEDIDVGDPDGPLIVRADSADAAAGALRDGMTGRNRYDQALTAVQNELEAVRRELVELGPALSGDGGSIVDRILSATDITGPAGREWPVITVEGRTPDLKNVRPDVMEKFGRLQSVLGRSIPVRSGYRSPARNERAGGAKRSQHMHGNALDLDVSGMSRRERIDLIRRASALGFTGIGVYNTTIHLDLGGRRSWGPTYKRASVPAWAEQVIQEHLGGGIAAELSPPASPASIVDRIVGAESAGDPGARNARSSATGLGQFVDKTWLEVVRKHAPAVAKGRSEAEILAMRTDPALSRQMVKAYVNDNVAFLRKNGIDPTDGNIYLAHFAGPAGAVKILKASPDASAESVLGSDVIRANPHLRGKSAAWVARWAAGKVVDGRWARDRAGRLRARAGRLVDAMGRYVGNTSAEAQDALARAAEQLSLAAGRARLVDLRSVVDGIMSRPEVRSAIADMLTAIQKGERVGPARPVDKSLRSMGGVRVGSPADIALRDRGITPRTNPGLFRRDGGITDLSNIPASEIELMASNPQMVAENGYLDPQSLVDALEAEARGDRLLAPDELARVAEIEQFQEALRDLGIDVDEATAEQVEAAFTAADARERESAERLAALAETPPPEIDSLDVSPDLQEDITGHLDAPPPDDAAAPAAPSGRIFVNHARINTPDDVKELIQAVADADADFIDQNRRGVVTHEQTTEDAKKHFQNIEDLIGRKPGAWVNDAEAKAAWDVLVSSGESLMRLYEKVAKPTATEADMAALARAEQVHYAIQSAVTAGTTETARALQAHRIPRGSSRARLTAIRSMIDNKGGPEEMQKRAILMAALKDNPAAMNHVLRDSLGGRVRKAFYEIWLNGLLSSPKTHAVNMTSNAAVAVWAIPERFVAAAISRTVYEGDVRFGEASAMAYGMVNSVRDAIALAVGVRDANGRLDRLAEDIGQQQKIDTGGEYQRATSAAAFGVDPASPIGKAMDLFGRANTVALDLLGREDAFFKVISFRGQLHAHAYRMAHKEGHRGEAFAARVWEIVNDPPQTMRDAGFDFAAYNTFTNELGATGRAITQALNRVPAARLIVPFIRTPTNIMKYVFQRTPLALASAAIRADIRAGGERGAVALARISMGSAMLLATSSLVAQGLLVGGGPEDPEQRKTWLATGAKPYSVKIGERWYQFNRLDPIGMMLGMGADIGEIVQDSADPDAGGELVTAGVYAVADNVLSKTWLMGVTEFLGAIDPRNPARNPGDWLADFSTTLKPYSSLIRNFATAGDPVVRDTRVLDEAKADVSEYWQTIVAKWKATIPGLSGTLPPRYDLFGNVITRESGLGVAYDFISPIPSKEAKADPVVDAFVDNKVDIGMPRRVIDGAPLTPEEYAEYTREAGQMAYGLLRQLVESPGFDRVPGGRMSLKSEILRDIVLEARRNAAELVKMRFPDLRQRIAAKASDRMQQRLGQ